MNGVARQVPSLPISAGHGILPRGQAPRPPREAGRRSRRKAGSSPRRPRCRAYAMMPVDVVKTGPLGTPPFPLPGLARSPALTSVGPRRSDRLESLLQRGWELLAGKQIPG